MVVNPRIYQHLLFARYFRQRVFGVIRVNNVIVSNLIALYKTLKCIDHVIDRQTLASISFRQFFLSPFSFSLFKKRCLFFRKMFFDDEFNVLIVKNHLLNFISIKGRLITIFNQMKDRFNFFFCLFTIDISVCVLNKWPLH